MCAAVHVMSAYACSFLVVARVAKVAQKVDTSRIQKLPNGYIASLTQGRVVDKVDMFTPPRVSGSAR
jgi:hypothetical protein